MATEAQPAATAAEIPKALQGLNPKLVEKIRAKEAARAKAEMTRDAGALRKLAQLRRMANLARMTRSGVTIMMSHSCTKMN